MFEKYITERLDDENFFKILDRFFDDLDKPFLENNE